MAITDSRLKRGTLTLDATEFGAAVTAVSLVPSSEEVGEDVEVLSGDELTADEQTSWVLSINAIQDFDDSAGLIEYARANAGTLIPFSWMPNDGSGAPTYDGTVRVRAMTIGGNVAQRNTSETEWPVQGSPSVTYPA